MPKSTAEPEQALQDTNIFFECKRTVLRDMQHAAFERENHQLLTDKCKQFPQPTPSELLTLEALIRKGRSATPAESKLRLELFSKDGAYDQCWNEEAYALSFAAINRWSEENTKSKRAAFAATADDIDPKGLSPGSHGEESAQQYEAVLRWFRLAADLGNADAMLAMSWIYSNGSGHPCLCRL
jgi:hypothetical protein